MGLNFHICFIINLFIFSLLFIYLYQFHFQNNMLEYCRICLETIWHIQRRLKSGQKAEPPFLSNSRRREKHGSPQAGHCLLLLFSFAVANNFPDSSQASCFPFHFLPFQTLSFPRQASLIPSISPSVWSLRKEREKTQKN